MFLLDSVYEIQGFRVTVSVSVGKNTRSCSCVSLSFRVIWIIVTNEEFTRKIFADSAVCDSMFARTSVERARPSCPERFSLQGFAS